MNKQEWKEAWKKEFLKQLDTSKMDKKTLDLALEAQAEQSYIIEESAGFQLTPELCAREDVISMSRQSPIQ
jgi:hypothetical protein